MNNGNSSERIIICNWNFRGDRIVKELHAPQAVPDCPIVVLSENKIDSDKYYKLQYYQNVTFIYGDPMDKQVLEFVKAHRAKSVIILADDQVQDPDAKSTLIALAITKLHEKKAKEKENLRKPHISAESRNHRKIEHLRDAGVDEVVCSMDYGLGLLAQSAVMHDISFIYDNLLRYSQDTNEVYILKNFEIPPKIWEEAFLDKTFGQAGSYLQLNRNEENPIILIGVRRGKKIFTNPRREEIEQFDVFTEGDEPIFMAYEKPFTVDER